MEKVTMAITGMSCGHCVAAVQKALQAVDGVEVREVRIGSATVAYEPGVTSPAQLAEAIDDAGYEARPVAAA